MIQCGSWFTVQFAVLNSMQIVREDKSPVNKSFELEEKVSFWEVLKLEKKPTLTFLTEWMNEWMNDVVNKHFHGQGDAKAVWSLWGCGWQGLPMGSGRVWQTGPILGLSQEWGSPRHQSPHWGGGQAKARLGHRPTCWPSWPGPMTRQGRAVGSWRLALLWPHWGWKES